jgi:Carboxypeptidase regulatory-like domain
MARIFQDRPLATNQKGGGPVFKTAWVFLAMLVILLCGSSSVIAQNRNALVEGKILDPQGNPLTHASVILRSVLGDNTRTSQTGDTDSYSFVNVTPGEYIITASADGLARQTISMRVKSDTSSTIPGIQLPLASVQQSVVVSGSRVESCSRIRLNPSM